MCTLNAISPGSVILDLEEEVLPDIVTRIVEELITDCQIEEDHKAVFKWMFELRHRSVYVMLLEQVRPSQLCFTKVISNGVEPGGSELDYF